VLIIRRSKLHYTASGIITPIGVLSKKQKFWASSWLITEISTRYLTVFTVFKILKEVLLSMVMPYAPDTHNTRCFEVQAT